MPATPNGCRPTRRSTGLRNNPLRGERVVPDSSTVPAMMFGNRICLCLAGKLELPAVTCDTMWRELDIGVDIRVLR